jgi:signal transduction histidine kinase
LLREVSSLLAGEPELDRTLRRVVQTVARALGADVCAFLLFDEASRELVPQPGAVGVPEGEDPLRLRVSVDDSRTFSGPVFLTREPLLRGDARRDPRVHSRSARAWNYRSLMVVPLIAGDKCIGVLRAGHRRPDVFTPKHVRLALLVAGHAAAVIENARLNTRVHQDVRELRRLNGLQRDFLSMVSHELLSPLSSVEGFVKVLLKEDVGPLGPRQKKFLDLCARSLERVTLLIEDLLDHSRIEAGVVRIRLEPVDPAELLRAAAGDQELSAREKGLSLSVELPPVLPVVTADPHRLRQVVDNFLRNALKFTPQGGRVLLSARADSKELLVSVRDNGVGIPEAELEKVFERFYQVEQASSRRVRGSGLGLAICKSLVERHGGRIWVDSVPGEGSNFQFSIPLTPPAGPI